MSKSQFTNRGPAANRVTWLRPTALLNRSLELPDNEPGLVEYLGELQRTESLIAAKKAEAMVALDTIVREREERRMAAMKRELAARIDALEAAGQTVPAHLLEDGPKFEPGRGVPHQIGLATKQSPAASRIALGVAKALTEMPHTSNRLNQGHLTWNRATALVRETACLPAEDRRAVDEELCSDPATLAGAGVRRVRDLARAASNRLQPGGELARFERSKQDRTVFTSPLPDGMVRLTAVLPLTDGIKAYASLYHEASKLVGHGEETRTRAQIMADLLTERLSGLPSGVSPVCINLIMPAEILTSAGTEPAMMFSSSDGEAGRALPIPAQVARTMTAAGIDLNAAWLRKLYAHPGGDLIASTSKQRFHPEGLANWLRVRDQGICRTPWCDAPATQLDHSTPHHEGGETTLNNTTGLCQACNLAKEQPGWQHATSPPDSSASGRHEVDITTPTGHHYRSIAPLPPGVTRLPTASNEPNTAHDTGSTPRAA